MKRYNIEIIEDETGLHIKRHNKGFTIHELMTFVDDTKMDLMVIWKDIMKGCIEKRITFDSTDTGGREGEIHELP